MRCRSSSALVACSGYMAMPRLAPSTSETASAVKGESNSAWMVSASFSTGPTSATPVTRTANWSPVNRARVADAGSTACDPLAHLQQQPVAGGHPERVVHLFEGVEVDEHQSKAHLGRPGPLDGCVELVEEGGAVGQTGHGVVQGQVGLLLGLVLEVSDEAAVLESDVGVVGQRLEDTEVLVDELAHLGQPVAHEHGAGGDAVGGERHDGGVLDADLGQPPGKGLPRFVEPGHAIGQQDGQISSQLGRRDVAAARVLPREEDPCRRSALADGLEQQGPLLTAQDRPSTLDDGPFELLDLQRATQPAGEVVQRLKALVPLSEPRVGAVEDEQRCHDTEHEQPDVGPVPDRH